MNMILLQALAKGQCNDEKWVLQWVPKKRCLAGLTGRHSSSTANNNCDSGEGAHQWPVGCLKKRGKRILDRKKSLKYFAAGQLLGTQNRLSALRLRLAPESGGDVLGCTTALEMAGGACLGEALIALVDHTRIGRRCAAELPFGGGLSNQLWDSESLYA